MGRRALRPVSMGVLLLAASWGVAAADEPVWETLRAPGTVVVLRHSYAPGGFDPPDRCLDTARLAFGKVEAWDVLQGSLNDAERRQAQLVEMRKRIAAHQNGPPLVLVTHGSVVTDLTGRNIRMGELVVLRREPDGTHKVTGQLYVD